MKGIVFNLLEEIVVRDYGEATWDALLDSAELDGAYTSLGNYPDDELLGLVGAASDALDLPPDAVVQWYGRNALPLLAERFPQLFAEHVNVRSFVLSLNEIIHPEVRKLYPGATPPGFTFDTSSEEWLVMDYESPRRLCSFAEGLLLGAGDHYEETVAVSHLECMKKGDERCRMRVASSP